VEFAILAPLLIILLFGIIEFGWGIGQQLDLRSKTREAARIGMVGGTAAEVTNRVCGDDLVKAVNILRIERTDIGGSDPGDTIEITMEADIEQITGLFSAFWGTNTITSISSGRIEQPADGSWDTGTSLVCP
jgi:TadE-like protein